MDSLMFKELVKSRVFPVISILLGSVFLASCSSGVSRFDMPMFGLSKSDNQNGSTGSLSGGARLGQGANELVGSNPGGLSGFSNNSGSNAIIARSSDYNARSSYLPPQTAAPEVRSARYGVIERRPVENRSGGSPYGRTNQGHSSIGMNRNSRQGSDYNSQPMRPIREARRSFLPSEPSQYNYNSKPNMRQSPTANRSGQRPSVNKTAIRTGANGSQKVSVGAGETLYSISRRHNVSVMKLMEINDLADSNLTVGQQLVIPGDSVNAARTPRVSSPRPVRATSSGTYTVRDGEKFQTIARKLNIDAAELADVNGITNPDSIRAGEVLILPATKRRLGKSASVGKKKTRPKARGPQDLAVRSVKTKTIKLGVAKSKSTSASRKTASIAGKSNSAKSKTTAFRWPVRGRIIGKFGPRGDGTHNDGINLAVPNGTKVKAAESGVVAYAGSELKGYGNLILIRHSNDWVSAYAHNDKLLVKRGDTIKRGQVVARAGTTGTVEQPQVHFELRKGSKPVDPTGYMAGT